MNQIMDIEDFKRHEWKSVLAEMHSLMNIKRTNLEKFPHCTDRRNLFEKAEIESFKHWEYPWMIKHSKLKSGQKILDCGCGRGFLQFYLARKGMKVTSLDVSTLKPKFVRKFWKFCEDKNIFGAPFHIMEFKNGFTINGDTIPKRWNTKKSARNISKMLISLVSIIPVASSLPYTSSSNMRSIYVLSKASADESTIGGR